MARKRMLLTIDENLHTTLKELSKAMGTPAASFVTNLLEELQPRFQATLDAINLAKEGKIEAIDKFIDLADESKKDVSALKKKMSKDRKKHSSTKPGGQ